MIPLRPSGEGCSQLMMIAVELTALPVGVSGGLVGTIRYNLVISVLCTCLRKPIIIIVVIIMVLF